MRGLLAESEGVLWTLYGQALSMKAFVTASRIIRQIEAIHKARK